ncbi:MAG: ABC transporter permease subunit [Candidatus Riflebacteria bacterium]|nr:ABC transporter permease subunit [Candidatus Riflebacteria bacterium]
MAALTICRFTLVKALRERVYLLFLLMTLVFIAGGGALSFHNTGVQLKFQKDVAFLCISGFGFLLCLFQATELLPHELETRGVHFLLSKPVRRLDLVLGKYLALLAVLAATLVPLSAELFGMVWLYSGQPEWRLLVGAALIGVELAVFGAAILLLSTLLTRLITFFASIFLYVSAHLSDWIVTSFLASSPTWLREPARVVLAVVPDLSHFDSRYLVVHDYDVPAGFVLWLLAYAAVYAALFLLAARWVLEAREY